ncbi:MAG: glycosyl hydrolase-related protein [Chloroflexota bacterium]|nr:glycosyl hydrolase-related protein [Chloroflexota bacterium]
MAIRTWPEEVNSVRKATVVPLNEITLPEEIFIVPGAHFDYGWCAGISECLAYADELIKGSIDAITGPTPDYRFTVEYAAFLRHFLTRFPEYLPTVKQLIKERKLETTAAMVGYMEDVLDGELMVREIVHAKRYARDVLDCDLPTAQHSDLPGHTPQLPQLLAKAGVKYFSYTRFRPYSPVHWWEAPDGSRVLAVNHMNNYGWAFLLTSPEFGWLPDYEGDEPEVYSISEAMRLWPLPVLLMMGQSDLLPPVPEDMIAAAKKLTDEGKLNFTISTITGFFEAAERTGKLDDLPVYGGHSPYAFYALTALAPHVFAEARHAENELASAEKLSAIRGLLGLGAYPRAELDAAWEDLFNCHDHNLSGRHGDLSIDARYKTAVNAHMIGQEIAREANNQFATHVNYAPPSKEARTLLVSNLLNWDRSEVVEDYMEFPGDDVAGIRITDGQGNEMPCQVIKTQNARQDRVDAARMRRSRVDFAFLAKDVPSLGFKTFYLEPRFGAGDQATRREIGEHVVENEHFRLDVSDGVVKSLQWKRADGTSIELAAQADHYFNEVVVLEDLRFDLEDSMDEQAMKVEMTDEALAVQAAGEDWLADTNFTGREWRASDGPTQVQWVERGPIWTTVSLRSHVVGAPITQEIHLHNQEPRVDFTTTIDWSGTKNTQVRIALPFNVADGEVTYEVPFGNVVFGKDEMPNTYRGDGARWVQKWLDVSNDEFGITLGTSNCVHAIHGATIYPMPLRTSYSCGTPFFEYPNLGAHTFHATLVPHEGDWRSAHAERVGWQHWNPLQTAKLATAAPMQPFAGRTFLNDQESFVRTDAPNVVITTIQEHPDRAGNWLLRLFEAHGEDTTVTLQLPRDVAAAWVTNLMGDLETELFVSGNAVTLMLGGYAIETIAVAFAS